MPGASPFADPPDPDACAGMDDLIGRLRLLKAWAGDPSYGTITRRINAGWAGAGRPERTTKNTVADCFALGRSRPSEDLVLGVVAALHPDDAYVARWQRALRILRGEAVAATFVRAHDRLPDDPPGFTGRDRELRSLRRLVGSGRAGAGAGPDGGASQDGGAVAVIVGMAGVGKTQLAVHAAHRFLRDGAFDRVLFVNLRGFHPEPGQPPADPAAVLDAFVRLLGVPPHAIPHGLEQRTGVYRRRLGGQRVLVLLDNAATVTQVRPLLATAPDCLTLVTSRRGLPDVPGAEHVWLDVFTPGDAVDLVRRAAGVERFDAEPEVAALITQLLGHLPLALGLTASRIMTDAGWTLTDHLERLVDHSGPDDVRHAVAGLLTDRPRLAGTVRLEDPVRRALDLSYDRVGSGAARTFRLLALHPGADADPYAAAALAGTGLATARRHLDQLAAATLLRRRGTDRYELHDLVRAYGVATGRDTDPPSERRAALRRLLDYYRHTAATAMDHYAPTERDRRPAVRPVDTPVPDLAGSEPAIAWLDTERTNLVAAGVHAAEHGWPAHAADLSRILYRYLDTHSHHHDAEILHGHAGSGGEPAGRARALVNLGVAHWRLGRHHAAIERLGQALRLYRGLGDRAGECGALSNLGVVYERLGRYGEALDHDRRALAGYRELGDRHGEGIALGNLGIVNGKLGRYPQALQHLRLGLTAFREQGDRINEGRMLANLADACWRCGDDADAVSYATGALRVATQVGNRIGQAAALGILGDVHRRLEHYSLALDHQRRALAIYREVGNRNGEAEALNGIGESLRRTGSPEQAAELHREALAVAADIGDRHEQARAYDGLAHCHGNQGDPERARGHWRQALAIYTELGAPEATQVAARL